MQTFMQAFAPGVASLAHGALAKKFPEGIAPDHPLAVFARRVQVLVKEAREDIAKATKPH